MSEQGLGPGKLAPVPKSIPPFNPSTDHDFKLVGAKGDTVFMLFALTDEAKAWVTENVSTEGFQPGLPEHVYVGWRYVDALLDGIDADGLTVDAIERALRA